MTETEPVKKSKKLLEQERLGLEEAIRLQEQVDEEERAQVARDEEIARQLLALDEERVTTDPKTTKDIDWNDPSVQNNYKMKDFEGMSYAEIRLIFEKVWDYNHNIVPMDLDIEKEKKKPAELRSTTKRQKVELDDEKEDLKGYLDIVPREEVAVDVDFLSTKYNLRDLLQAGIKESNLSTKPEGYDLMLWGDLHTLFEPDEESEIWKNQNEVNQKVRVLFDICGVHISTDAKWNCQTISLQKKVTAKSRNDIKDAERNKQEELFTHKEEMAHMALSDSKVNNDKSCSKTCLTNYEALKKQYDDLLVKLSDTDFKAATYKRGLATLEGQIVKYREHEVLFSEEIALLKRSVGSKEYQMGLLRAELEKVKQEKEGFEFKIAKFDKSAKDLDQLLGSQITDNSKKGLGYSAVPPPHPLIYNRPNKLDLSYSGLDEFKEPEFKGYGPENSKKESNGICENSSNETKIFSDAPLIEEWVSDNEDEVESHVVVEKKTDIPTTAKIEKPVRKPVRYAEMYRSQRPRGNQRNWNGQKSNQLGCNFVFNNKACFICGSFDHIQYSCPNQQRKRIVSGNNYNKKDNDYYSKTSHPSAHKHMAPRAVLMKTGLKSFNTARPVNTVRSVNTGRPFSTARSFNTVRPSYTAHPKSTIHCARPRTYFQNQAQSTVHRPFYKRTTLTKRCFNQRFNTGRPFRSTVNTVRARGFLAFLE
ncbi:hypothetical protein Tco_1430695 [Tanacetum coccineum]